MVRRRKSSLIVDEEEKNISNPLIDVSEHICLARKKKAPSKFTLFVEEDTYPVCGQDFMVQILETEKLLFPRYRYHVNKQFSSLEEFGGIRGPNVCAVLLTVFVALYSYYYIESVHFHLTHAYAHLGYASAQHLLAHKYLEGSGVETNHTAAFQWFRKAAIQGHPHSAYNLAVGHMQGYRTDVNKGEAHILIKYASKNGVDEATQVLRDTCSRGHCDH